MSIIAPALRRSWWPYAVAALGLSILAIAAATLAPRGSSDAPSAAPASVAAPGVEQPAWTSRAFVRPKSAAKAAKKQTFSKGAVAAEATVAQVFDSLFLEPGELDKALSRTFEGPAAKQFRSAKLGLPNGASEVAIESRALKLSLDPDARSAVALVRIKLAGQAGSGAFALSHQATLWMERDGKAWKVIAFDAQQGPLK